MDTFFFYIFSTSYRMYITVNSYNNLAMEKRCFFFKSLGEPKKKKTVYNAFSTFTNFIRKHSFSFFYHQWTRQTFAHKRTDSDAYFFIFSNTPRVHEFFFSFFSIQNVSQTLFDELNKRKHVFHFFHLRFFFQKQFHFLEKKNLLASFFLVNSLTHRLLTNLL